MNFNSNKIKLPLQLTAVILISIIVTVMLVKELSAINLRQTINAFRDMSTLSLVELILLGLLSVMVLTLYDFILTRALKINMPVKHTAAVSYIICTLNNILGLGGFIGAGLRFFAYSPFTTDKKQLSKSITLLLFSMLSGLSVLSLLMVFDVFDISSLTHHVYWSKYIIYVGSLYLIFYILWSIIKPAIPGNRWLGLQFIMVSLLDWLSIILLFYFILLTLDIKISFTVLAGMIVTAALAGILSMMPGGFGTFDLVILINLKAYGIPEDKVLLSLLLYRAVYYFFPSLVALVLSIVVYKEPAKSYLEENRLINSAMETTSFFKGLQKDMPYQFQGILLALFCIITSVIYYFNHFLIIYDALYTNQYTYHSIIIVFHITASLALLICSNGVMHNTKRGILMSIISTLMLIATTALSYGTIISYSWLALLTLMLGYRYSKAKSIKRSITPITVLISIVVIAAILIINQWLTVNILDLYNSKINNFNLTLLNVLAWIAILLYLLVGMIITRSYSKRYDSLLNCPVSYETLCGIISEYGGNYVSHLSLSGDKSFFINEEADAFLMYRKTMNACIVLGDPIGNSDKFIELLNNFYDKTTFLGHDVVFYQVQEKYMSLYHEYGNSFFKLGEEALIDLSTFTVSGKKQRAFRATMNKVEKEGYHFKIIEPPLTDAVYSQLKAVSDRWLSGKEEMSFSVGSFNRDYLNQAPIAVIASDTEIAGFCSLMPTYYNGTLSVDLIRWRPEMDMPMMDALYLYMLQYAQQQEYTYFNMGMATLSNVGQNRHAYIREKVAGNVFEHFNNYYSFQGLRKYKQKFNPLWESRYLVYRKYTSLAWNLIRVSITINKKQ
ncbi:bifunctional lysylphosphatidylglycerol flippase/synthetase MprF [Macrococcus equipercicus]|uniref:Phosphatidylglycerol lysyltransferase n=1 Tax=Macrococcus equipercicus TaxID=69967 RepID=A0A9Q9BLT5_9STAP|nr:bifunctional lysylphosphatidylglycerol flippase/synthetase MprF [Macrococcus equipercicus]KAA1039579.1 bifunctional lysylphosphatidylglycerol flippase/synthetase MprF [Macrococcus equipercicus]UTH13908.1 bifunctional lysylphosphatidylglycerol flippase/synthetase MprF [Macrococcus equipercicus]